MRFLKSLEPHGWALIGATALCLAFPGAITTSGNSAKASDTLEWTLTGDYNVQNPKCCVQIYVRTGATQRYPIDRDGPTGLSGNRATAIAEDSTGLIWVGTDGAGLNLFDPVSHRFRHFFHDPHDPSSLSSDTVYSVCADARGRVWVGTRGGGLDQVVGNPLVANSVRFENLSENDGLPNSNVYGIVPDELGRVWLSTNRGLAAYDPATRSVRTFRRSHGLQGDEFNFGAYFRGRDGTVFFGGPNGYNSFVPERLHFNTLPPRIALTEVLKANTPVSRTPEALTRLALGFRDNVLTLRFAALDFTGTKENRYQYRLDGFNDRWIDAGNVGQATYTNLNGGRYTFRVRAANSDGVWNERGLGIDLQVDPPPWQTWWARTIYGLVIAGIILAVWLWQRWRVEREAAYARRLRREVEDRTAELDERNRAMELANKQLREASITDPLTGLGNRRCLRDTMVESASAQDAAPSVLMIVDLDHLKPINDQYGHDGGDAVINRIAEILRHLFRSADLIVRWGGDEFVVWCRGCDLETASALAERVRVAVAKCIFHVGDGAVARTSCSIGFATVPFIPQAPELLDWEQSLNLADMALYRAKSERNSWLGWSGTEAAAHIPSLLVAIESDSAALERSGVLQVRRCQHNMEDTVDHLRARSRADGR